MNPELIYEVASGVATLTINRPAARNALNKAVRTGITTAIADFSSDKSAKVLILTSSGDKAFSAGADLKEMAELGMTIPPEDYLPILKSEKPIIALVNGIAVGGGFYLVMQADVVIAAEHATFGITEARYGRGAPWAVALPLLLPPKVAMEMLLTGNLLSSHRALEIGLINAVVPASNLMSAGQAIATQIAANAPLTVAAGKKMVTAVMQKLLSDFQPDSNEIWRPIYLSEDAQEGPLAFSEKRPPHWLGK
jgi:enoyl-CoA hydratase/carnithine racemase